MGHQEVQGRRKSVNDAVIPVLPIGGISCNFPPYVNKNVLIFKVLQG